MPELPEVETTIRRLRKVLPGDTIKAAKVRWPRSLAEPSLTVFKQEIQECVIKKINRRGKYIIFELLKPSKIDRPRIERLYLLLHLRMSGRLEVENALFAPGKHDHVMITLGSGRIVRFRDPRKFGRLWLVSDPELLTAKLGPEPLGSRFTAISLFQALKQRKGAIKPALLDQSFVAGLGNIYTDESLWRAQIHPLTPCSSITLRRAARLRRAICQTLKKALETKGTDAGDGVVAWGGYRPQAYGRGGCKCPRRCGACICRMVIAQRGTHFCPRCQRLEKQQRLATANPASFLSP